MNSKTTQFSTAAIVLLALGLFLANLSDPIVYGMPEIPAMYQSAKTLHLKGTQYFPENNSSQSAQIEYWIDLENNRWRSLTPSYTVNDGDLTIFPTERLYDGNDTMMAVDHTQKQVGYYKLSRLQQDLQQREQLQQWRWSAFGDPSLYDAYEVVDSETIDGDQYEIWEAIVTQHSSFTRKKRTWVSPRTGSLLKSKTWVLSDEGLWQLSFDIGTIERDIEFAQDVFSMDPISEYEAANTRDTPEPMPRHSVTIGSSNFSLTGYYLFALPDGSLIACWTSTNDSSSDSQEGLFSNLQTGAAFPELPYRVHSLKVLLDEKEFVFNGCHLASTSKEGRYYEWGLYVSRPGVPDERLHSRSFLFDCQAIEEIRGSGRMWLSINAVIETDDDFNDLVLQAMAEFSDDQALPALSLEEVLSLAAQKRREL